MLSKIKQAARTAKRKTCMMMARLSMPKMLTDTRASVKASDWIVLVISLIMGVILVPIVVDQVQNTNTTGWDFTGSSGAETLFLLLPFVFIVGIVIYFISRLLE